MISGLTNHAFQSGNLMEGLGGVWGKGLSLAVASRMVLWYLSDYIVTSAEFGGGGVIVRECFSGVGLTLLVSVKGTLNVLHKRHAMNASLV